MVRSKKTGLGPPYPSPPITECVLELRFQDTPKSNFAEKAARRLRQHYDHSQTDHIVNFEVGIDANGAVKANTNAAPVIKLTSGDQADLCSVVEDKIYWGRLAPYTGWDEFAARVSRDLAALKRDIGKRPLSRVGLRYLNRIDVPAKPVPGGAICRYEDYLAVKIDLPDFLDPTEGFDWRVRKIFKDRNLAAMIRSSVMEPVLPQMGAFLLDIDVYRESLDATVAQSDIDGMLCEMRDLKNQIFERSITDLARESFH